MLQINFNVSGKTLAEYNSIPSVNMLYYYKCQ